MPYAPIIRLVAVTGIYTAISSTALAFKGDIGCPPTNAAAVNFREGASGSDVAWLPGEWHEFGDGRFGVDLSQIYVKGTTGDVVQITGEQEN